jgi:hypothetical protein
MKGDICMDNIRKLNQRYEILAWGTLFLWVGVRDLIPGLPIGTGMLGIGLILLGLNLARRISDIPINGVSTALGAAALLVGAVELFRSLQGIQVELPFFPVLLVMVGVGFLAHSLTGMKTSKTTENG